MSVSNTTDEFTENVYYESMIKRSDDPKAMDALSPTEKMALGYYLEQKRQNQKKQEKISE
jgi:hypothetical protein